MSIGHGDQQAEAEDSVVGQTILVVLGVVVVAFL